VIAEYLGPVVYDLELVFPFGERAVAAGNAEAVAVKRLGTAAGEG
jgi:hypothetical protein